jgi:hypothetical protein
MIKLEELKTVKYFGIKSINPTMSYLMLPYSLEIFPCMSCLHTHFCFCVCLCMTPFINNVLTLVPVDYTIMQEWLYYCARL